MKIQENGSYYTLPLTDYVVSGFAINGFPSLSLKVPGDHDAPVLHLTIQVPFKLTFYGQELELQPHLEVSTWQQLLELWQQPVRKALAYKTGELFIDFGHNTELLVPDSEYESWIIYHVFRDQVLHTWVVGGVGSSGWYPLLTS